MRFDCIILSLVIIGRIEALKNLARVCAKKDLNVSANPQIKIPATGFKDLVQHSDVFVDKSMLIKSILEAGSLVSLIYPEKWGKTTNLDMLKVFVESQLDSDRKAIPRNSTWSYKYFKCGDVEYDDGRSVKLNDPPLISAHSDVIERFLGQYMVVWMDLGCFSPAKNVSQEFYKAFTRVISDVYLKFDYMIEYLRNKFASMPVTDGQRMEVRKDLDVFRKYKSKEVDSTEEMIESLKFLSDILFKYFEKKVFVMIDNYDYVMQKACIDVSTRVEPEDVDVLLDFYVKFLNATFVKNKNLGGGIVTGVLDINRCLKEFGFVDVVNLNTLMRKIPHSLGFTNLEVKQLFGQLHICEDWTKKIRAWYCGFYLLDFPEISFCNPWSIVNFANTRRLVTYWDNVEDSKIITPILHNEMFRKNLESLVIGQPLVMNYCPLNFNYADLKALNALSKNNTNDSRTDLIYKLHYAAGYLWFEVNSHSVNLIAQIPCKEIDFIIMKYLKNYYRGQLGNCSCDLAKKAAHRFVEFLGFEEGRPHMLLNSLRDLYHSLNDSQRTDDANFVTLLYVKSNHGYDIGFSRGTYMTIYGGNRGLIYGNGWFRNTRQINSVQKQAKELVQYKHVFENKKVDFVRYLFVAYDSLNNSIGGLMMNEHCPFDSSESGKERAKSNWWSYGLDEFGSYSLESSNRHYYDRSW